MCTTRATAAKYAERAERLESKKSRAHAAKVATRLRAMVAAGVVGNEGGAPKDVKWEVVRTDCLRETAVTRAPRTLRFHFVRSEYTPYGQLLKKTARVQCPLMFDLGPHMARGVWEPKAAVGSVAAALGAGLGAAGVSGNGNGQANGGAIGEPPRALYRLQSAILHYGYAHSSGHFVAIRRKPGAPLGVPGKGWLRISDADVDEVGADELASSGAAVFMLFYERVDLPDRRKVAEAGGELTSGPDGAAAEGGVAEGIELQRINGERGHEHEGDVYDDADPDPDADDDGFVNPPEVVSSFAGLGTPLGQSISSAVSPGLGAGLRPR